MATITPGTTPTLTFTIPFDENEIATLFISFSRSGAVRVEKDITECTLEDQKITCNLTQDDTLRFGNNQKIKVQIRVKKTSGEALASKPMYLTTDEILKDGVI